MRKLVVLARRREAGESVRVADEGESARPKRLDYVTPVLVLSDTWPRGRSPADSLCAFASKLWALLLKLDI